MFFGRTYLRRRRMLLVYFLYRAIIIAFTAQHRRVEQRASSECYPRMYNMYSYGKYIFVT